jgi:hypothetical protein
LARSGEGSLGAERAWGTRGLWAQGTHGLQALAMARWTGRRATDLEQVTRVTAVMLWRAEAVTSCGCKCSVREEAMNIAGPWRVTGPH